MAMNLARNGALANGIISNPLHKWRRWLQALEVAGGDLPQCEGKPAALFGSQFVVGE
jgi:hypothetical protein